MYPKKFALMVLLCFGLLGFAQKPTITFAPHWLPQAQFAGYYIALEKGFYAEEGIQVKISHPSASVNALEKLKSGEADIISLFLVSAITAKAQGLNLVNMGQISQNSALLFVSKQQSGIEKLADLQGKRIGVWHSGFDEVGKALMKSNGVEVQWVPILSSVNLFLMGGIDAMTVMWYNEYQQIINTGVDSTELNTFFFSDFDFNVPEDGLYCLHKTMLEKGEELKKFKQATIRGWEYAQANKDETLDLVMRIMKEHNIANNRTHQEWMLDKILQLIEPTNGTKKKWELLEQDYVKACHVLNSGGYITQSPDFSEFVWPSLSKQTD